MRVLWLCNVIIPEVGKQLGIKRNVFGGWIEGAWNILDAVEKAICVPILNPLYMKDGNAGDSAFYGFKYITGRATELEKEELIVRFEDILEKFKPDVVHIWGTEYVHSLCMVEACREKGLLNNVVVNIQGILSEIAKVYDFGLTDEMKEKISIIGEINDFKDRAVYEQEILKTVRNVSGRTDWDYKKVKKINPNVRYYYCNEILRDEFYNLKQKWSYNRIEKNSIFLSQIGYSIKGFHLILKQLNRLSSIYKDFKIYISGHNVYEEKTDYDRYIVSMIKFYELQKNIEFVGFLNANEMIEMYMRVNAFVCPSILENSSNSICEAMMLGTPVVASNVGGNSSMIKNKRTGYLYDIYNTDELISRITSIFDKEDLAKRISEEEIAEAELRQDRGRIKTAIMEMYNEIAKEN